MEEVECAECSNRYDSQVHTFCPRCGNARQRGAAVSYRPQAFDPRRRRAQAGGVILLTTAALSLVLYGYGMVVAPQLLTPELAGAVMQDQPGGTLEVRLDGLDGATVNVTRFDGTPLRNATAVDGTATFEDLESAAVNVRVQHGSGHWSRQALVLEGQAVTLRVGSDDPMADSTLAGADQMVTPIRVVLGFFAAVAAFVVLAGVSALRLRHRGIAIAGAVIGLLPVLMLAVAFPTVGSLLLLVLLGVALAFIVAGRMHFR